MKYVAFLRGINVGGNMMVKMEELKKTFESLKFRNVKTILNSGNVIFETEKTAKDVLTKEIETVLEKKFNFHISVMVRSTEEIQQLVNSDPFKQIKITPETRLYVTFLADPSVVAKSTLKIPYETREKDFKILSITETEICSIVILSPQRNTTDLMKVIEKEFGKDTTTRNWNTVLKVLK